MNFTPLLFGIRERHHPIEGEWEVGWVPETVCILKFLAPAGKLILQPAA
jgi:hypothetical protein